MIHLEGFGVIGCTLAWVLRDHGIQFTWSDIDASVCAWKACTGAVYPSSDPRDARGYHGWSEWFIDPPWKPLLQRRIVESADYWYRTKQPPHGYHGEPVRIVGSLRLHQQPSYHLNAQRFVEETRTLFARAQAPPAAGDQIVVAHGFNERLRRYVWGWTRPVILDTTQLGSQLIRPSVYLRRGRVIMAYAYPMPGDNHWWYAGSTLLVQRVAKSRDMTKDFERWLARWNDMTDGLLPVRGWGTLVQGWRPSTGSVADERAQPLWTRRDDGALVVMPCWHSGVRWLPCLVDEFFKELDS